MPAGLSRLVTVGASLFVFLFVSICNKLRSRAVFPRRAAAVSLLSGHRIDGGLELDVVDIAEVASIPKITGAARNSFDGRALL
jgi:hypothetical protein